MARHNRRDRSDEPVYEDRPAALPDPEPHPDEYVWQPGDDPGAEARHYRQLDRDRRRQRNQRRCDELIESLDWKNCCIPGCRDKAEYRLGASFSARESLPICMRHQLIIHNKVIPLWFRPDVIALRYKVAQDAIDAEAEDDAAADLSHESNGAAQGQIYFVRINGMIKVGWSSRLRSRLKSYGASAEILCHYPASRREETDLHRSLRPYLARGREWYRECQLIDDVIARAIKDHGEPSIKPYWTQPKNPVVGGKRYDAAS